MYVTEPLTDDQFPGISKIYSDIKDWNWVFGKTPKFAIKRTFAVHDKNIGWGSLRVKLTLEKGFVSECKIRHETKALSDLLLTQLNEGLTGVPFKYVELMSIFEAIQENEELSALDLKALQDVQEYFSNLLR